MICGAQWPVSHDRNTECAREVGHAGDHRDIRGNMFPIGTGDIVSRAASPDAPTTTNERGGSQSHIPVRFDLIDAKALFEVAGVLHEGAEKYAPGNWRLIPVRDHLNHLLMHTFAYLSGDRTDDHLSHAVCRAIFALACDLDPEATPEKDAT